jgi:hypothetical protein
MSEIIEALLEAQSPCISNIADRMSGNYDANYKSVQHFLESEDLLSALYRLFNEEEEFVIGDPTEIDIATPAFDYCERNSSFWVSFRFAFSTSTRAPSASKGTARMESLGTQAPQLSHWPVGAQLCPRIKAPSPTTTPKVSE